MKNFTLKSPVLLKKSISLTIVFGLTFTAFIGTAFSVSSNLKPAQAATPSSQNQRLAGVDRYSTAIQISQAGWSSASSVILARGDDYPDALAGAVLAHKLNAPLLLTDSGSLAPAVLTEIQRLQAQKVYLLGGTGALSLAVEQALQSAHISFQRLQGKDRYETSAAIASAVTGHSDKAFLASGSGFADALSISSYAAAQGIPLLLTDTDNVPQPTLNALQTLGVHSVTLVGGTGVITPAVQAQLEKLPMTVNRLAGPDRYQTDTAVLANLPFNKSKIYVATGESFPDALSGAALAAQQNNPILLIPPVNINPSTTAYLSAQRVSGSAFVLLGGWGVIPYGTESIIRTGSQHSRLSLQYVQGPSYSGELNQLDTLPNPATDYVDVVAPSWYALNDPPSGSSAADGSLSGIWDGSTTSTQYAQFVNSAHSRNLKVLPVIAGSSGTDSVLTSTTARGNLVNQITMLIQATGADGIVIDFETMQTSSGPGLTQLMQTLYTRLHPLNKLVVIAVMSRTGPDAESWLAEFNYHDLALSVDYLDIMTYDYSTSTPGPVAPLDWMDKVLSYTQSQGVDMAKVLLGIPYYARDWTAIPPKGDEPTTYTHRHWGYWGAMNTAQTYKAVIQRDTSSYAPNSKLKDTVGIPYFLYTDENKAQHTVYFDDPLSWEAKLSLLDKYGLGGIGAWSLYWVNSDTGNQLFPMLKRHLR
ncbi:MAG: cell wall-binding repeat-containing protein [Desulfitobacteriaceae bacterium]